MLKGMRGVGLVLLGKTWHRIPESWLNFYAVLLLGLAAGLVVGGVFVLTHVGNWTWLLNMAGTSTLSAVLSSRLFLTAKRKV